MVPPSPLTFKPCVCRDSRQCVHLELVCAPQIFQGQMFFGWRQLLRLLLQLGVLRLHLLQVLAVALIYSLLALGDTARKLNGVHSRLMHRQLCCFWVWPTLFFFISLIVSLTFSSLIWCSTFCCSSLALTACTFRLLISPILASMSSCSCLNSLSSLSLSLISRDISFWSSWISCWTYNQRDRAEKAAIGNLCTLLSFAFIQTQQLISAGCPPGSSKAQH